MTQSEVQCFLAVCRFGTATRAAESLYITQPSLSARLKTLERELGGPLFLRGKGRRAMTLTAAGRRFYSLAIRYEALTRQMLAVCERPRDVLRVSAINSVSTYFLPRVYDRFLQEYPDCHLEIQDLELGPAVEGIPSGTTDLAFTSGRVTDERLRQTRVFAESMVLIAGPGVFPDGAVTAEQLAGRREIYVEWSRSFAVWHRQTVGGDPPRITVSIMAQLERFMRAGDCWAVVPRSIADGLAGEGCPVEIRPTAFPLPEREISIVAAVGGTEGVAEEFLQCAKRSAADLDGVRPL